MPDWKRYRKLTRQLNLLVRSGTHGRLEPIGQQGLEPTNLPPLFKYRRITQKPERESIVIAFEKYRLERVADSDQAVENLARRRTAVDVVADEKENGPVYGVESCIKVDLPHQFLDQIGTTMRVANRIDTNAIGQPGRRSSCPS